MGQIRDIKEKSFQELFKDSFYVIPIYQRVYSWDEYNLNALWDDIVSVRDSISKIDSSNVNNHFMSSILVKEVSSENSTVRNYVVDGQQRMTTVFLFLHAAFDVLENRKGVLQGDFYRMVRKSLLEMLYGEDYHYDDETGEAREVRIPRLSLQNRDSSHAFNVLLTSGATSWTEKHEGAKVVRTYSYFKKRMSALLEESPNLFKRTVNTVLNHLHLIYIPILPHEAPQKIFESVNGLTKKLYAGELVKNFLLLSVTSEKDSDNLYRDYWAEFDGEEWTEDDKNKERLTKFLYYWVLSKGLKIQTHDEAVYRGFKRVSNLSIHSGSEVAKEVKEISADIHRSIMTLISLEKAKDAPSTRLEMSYSRLYSMRNALNSQSVFIQFLRIIDSLGTHFQKLTSDQLDKLLLPLESYIVRKSLSSAKYSGETTEFLGNLVANVFIHPSETQHKNTDDYLAEKVKEFCEGLAKAKGAGKRFNSTEYLIDYIAGNKKKNIFPKALDQSHHSLVRMLLLQVENYQRTNSFTPKGSNVNGNFSLEHWLPQSSNEKIWPLNNESLQTIYTNSIGNLCIIPQSINSHLSNSSLETKLEKVLDILSKEGHEKTGLHTFDKVIDLCLAEAGDISWNEQKINIRARWIMETLFNKIFKDIEHFTGKSRDAEELDIWAPPVEGRRIVAKSRGTIVRGYQLLDGTLIIDEVLNVNPIPRPSMKEYH